MPAGWQWKDVERGEWSRAVYGVGECSPAEVQWAVWVGENIMVGMICETGVLKFVMEVMDDVGLTVVTEDERG